MALAQTVLVIHPHGGASLVEWPADDAGRRAVVATEIGDPARKRRCGKGILGFAVDDETIGSPQSGAVVKNPDQGSVNAFAAAAYAEQGVELDGILRGPVLFARNPSKGSEVKPLTAAQTANLLTVTGARLA